MKDYEKLLQENENRLNMQKAINLIQLGLFNQEEVAEFDFTNKELITYGRKYKGIYDLYEDSTTGNLYFVYPLVENNADDEKYEIDLKPYAYNVISMDFIPDDEYQQVLKAGVGVRKRGRIKVAYVTQTVVLILSVVSALCYWSESIFSYIKGGTNPVYAIYSVLITSSVNFFCFLGIQLGAYICSTIAYRNYQNK